MIRTQVYLPKTLHHLLQLIAQNEHKPAAQVIREILAHGAQEKRRETTGEGLLRLASIHGKGPSDLSRRIDDYLYGES